MKKSILIIIGFLFIVPFEGLCQTAYYAMPNLTISPSNRSTLGNNIKRYGEIKTSGSFNLLQGTQTELISNEKITLSSPVIIKPSSSGTYANNVFNAKIEKTDLELVWFAPNSPGWVQKNDKLEIGIKLPSAVEIEINNFIANNTLPKLNPYNPEHIDIQADFYYKVGGSWVLNKKKYAFFYEEFKRDTTDSNPNNWDWIDVASNHRFRIRMTPEDLGEWKCEITTKINGVTSPTISSFLFNCYNSNLDGFVSSVTSPWSAFFSSLYINNEVFFPIGRAMPHPSCFTYTDLNGNKQDPYNCSPITDPPHPAVPHFESWDGHLMKTRGMPIPLKSYLVYEKELINLKNEGANFFRISRTPHDYFLEYENLGNYHNRMFLGWEMDKLLETLEDIDLKMYFTVSHSLELADTIGDHNWGNWNWDWNPNTLQVQKDMTLLIKDIVTGEN